MLYVALMLPPSLLSALFPLVFVVIITKRNHARVVPRFISFITELMLSPLPVRQKRTSLQLTDDYPHWQRLSNNIPSRPKSSLNETTGNVVDGAFIEALADAPTRQTRSQTWLGLPPGLRKESIEPVSVTPKPSYRGLSRSKWKNHRRQAPSGLSMQKRQPVTPLENLNVNSRDLSQPPREPQGESEVKTASSKAQRPKLVLKIHNSNGQPVQSYQYPDDEASNAAREVEPFSEAYNRNNLANNTFLSTPSSISPLEEFPMLRSCTVCAEETSIDNFPIRPTLLCSHESKTCQGCLSSWILSQLETTGWERVRCPDCPELLSSSEIRELADDLVFQRYDKMMTRAALSAILDFRWCLGPGCESGQIHVNGTDGPIMRCFGCGFKTCIRHEREWHHGETCEQYDDRVDGSKRRQKEKKTAAASMQLIFDTTKKCPGKGCGWNIEKHNGCDHMTCTKCRHEFCWQCLAPFGPIRKRGNSYHLSSCKYHTNNVRA